MSLTLKLVNSSSSSATGKRDCAEITLQLGVYTLCGTTCNPFALKDGRTIYGVPRSALEGGRKSGGVAANVMRDIRKDISATCMRACIDKALWARGEDSTAHLRQKRETLSAECVPLCFGREAQAHAKPIIPVQLLPLFLVRMERRLSCATNQREFTALREQLNQCICGAVGTGELVTRDDAFTLCYMLGFVYSNTWMHAALAPAPMLAPPPAFVPDDGNGGGCTALSSSSSDAVPPLPQPEVHRYDELRKRNVLALIGDVIESDLSAVHISYRRAFPGALNLVARAETRLGCSFDMVKEEKQTNDDGDNPRVKRTRKEEAE